jgi:hypothetical protein
MIDMRLIETASSILHYAMSELEPPVIVRGFDVEIEDDGCRLLFYAFLNDEDEALVCRLKLAHPIAPQDFVPMQWSNALASTFGGSASVH